MPRFFISSETLTGVGDSRKAYIRDEDAHHISRSLRMRIGEELTLCDCNGSDYLCRITEISDGQVTLDVISETENTSEPPYKVTVYQALVKGDKFDTVVQKSVEYGASSVVPLITSRCTVKLDSKDSIKKCMRWARIGEEAAKQCGRGIIPRIASPVKFDEMTKQLAEYDAALFCYEKAEYPIKQALPRDGANIKNIAVVIGPEGGFSDEEATVIKNVGVIPVSLGNRILRTESAAPFVLACLSYQYEQ